MADVQALLKNILSAVYGKDVRQSIHDAIQQCYYDGKAGGNDLEARDRAAIAEARIEQLASNKNVVGDTAKELAGLRVDIYGETHGSAGEAVRQQIREIHQIEVRGDAPTRDTTMLWIKPVADEGDVITIPVVDESGAITGYKQVNCCVMSIRNTSTGAWDPIPVVKGKSMYDIACEYGYTGSEEQFAEALYDGGWITAFQKLESETYKKNEILNEEVRDKFGLNDANRPSDIFSYLGTYARHWWWRKSLTTVVKYYKTTTWIGSKYNGASRIFLKYRSGTVQTSDSVTFDPDTGRYQLYKPSVSYNGFENVTHRGKYVYSPDGAILVSDSKGKYTDTPCTDIVYIPANPSKWGSYSSDMIYVTDSYPSSMHIPTAESYNVGNGVIDYVSSDYPDAYPHSGRDDKGKFEYRYLGIPYEKLPSLARVEFGSYIGTGTYTNDNPSNIPFGFNPNMVIIYDNMGAGYFAFHGQRNGLFYNDTASVITWSDKKISWYSAKSAEYQLNKSSTTYHYIAIG
jgi:hypothetical protein